ncbi:hypothetical protein EVAR_79283_1 [Eumeta japonica]|uniref:Uncharacterized protein n=1 Tax=Eumeta variegata TaxID=151549 RepID=A0A4C1TFF2_EUMVA|nr:hypothetical protein EVAR_79283_1 [Eumeta japonica]
MPSLGHLYSVKNHLNAALYQYTQSRWRRLGGVRLQNHLKYLSDSKWRHAANFTLISEHKNGSARAMRYRGITVFVIADRLTISQERRLANLGRRNNTSEHQASIEVQELHFRYADNDQFSNDQLDGSNLDGLNRSGPDLKICPRSEAVPLEQLCYFLTSIPGLAVKGAAIWRP